MKTLLITLAVAGLVVGIVAQIPIWPIGPSMPFDCTDYINEPNVACDGSKPARQALPLHLTSLAILIAVILAFLILGVINKSRKHDRN